LPEMPLTSSTTMCPRATRLIVVALLTLIGGLLFASVRQESQTVDEACHLFAGFAYWKHADFGRNPEHPPLAKLLASAPLLTMNLKEPSFVPDSFFKMQDYTNGAYLLYTADADAILLRGRMVVALFSLTLALLVFFAAREMFSPLTGIIALSVFAFEPVLLSNGALVTTDMPLTCLFFASVYSFYRYIKRPSLSRLALCATTTAFAIAAKHSGVLIFPTLFLLALSSLLIAPRQLSSGITPVERSSSHSLCRLAFVLVSIILLSYVFLWAIYGFRYAARPGQLQMIPTLAIFTRSLNSPLKQSVITFLARHHLFPEAYLYGWVDILRIPDSRTTFILGRVLPSGSWFFFPAVFLIKSTLTLLSFLLLVPFARIRGCRREILFLTIPVVFFLLVSILSMLNLGVRHILPIYPFCVILGAAAASSFATRSGIAKVAVVALLIFAAISSLRCFPDYLAYSNEIAGGPSHTYRLVTDSNADWGQGLKWTKTYLDQHSTSNCWFSYYNPAVNPAYYGIHCKPLLSGMNREFGIATPPIPSTITGTVLISATEAVGFKWGPDTLNPYQLFLDRKPDAIIGNSTLVYYGTFDVPLLAAQTNAVAAMNLLSQHRLPEAIALAQAAAQQAPDSADVNAVLGQALLTSSRIGEGQQAIATALHLAQTIHPEFQKRLIETIHRSNNAP
jgi:hypothetical protein